MLIEFSFNNKILILLIFPIVFQFEDLVIRLYIKHDNRIFRIFKIFLSFLFFIFLELIYKYRTRNINSHNSVSNLPTMKDIENDINSINLGNQVNIEIRKKKNKAKINNALFLFLLSFLVLLSYFINYWDDDNNKIKNYLRSIGIFFEIMNFGILSHFILDANFYRHHILSLFIMFISLITLFISLADITRFKALAILYFFIYTLSYSLYNILGKKYFDLFFKTPHFMLFFIGIINVTGLLIYDIITYFCKREISGIILGFKDNITSIKDVLIFLLELLIKFVYTLGVWLVIYYFTPCHFIISDILCVLISYIIRIIKHSEEIIIISIIIYFIVMICSLIFNEIIILKFCNLEFYTKKYINLRERIDSAFLISNNPGEDNEEDESSISEHHSS